MSTLTPPHEGPYSYRLSRDRFRFIILNRGDWQSPLRCQLISEKLDTTLSYQALSYAWGSPSVTRPIVVNNINMMITINLDTALRYLRRENADIVLWVDALCINQADLDEREVQVGIMRQIYHRADNVIVFLGDGTTHTSSRLRVSRPQEFLFHNDSYDSRYVAQFLSYCRDMPTYKLCKSFGIFCLISLFAQQEHQHIKALLSLKTRVLQAIFEDLRMMLLSRWWNRMWVFQEVIVSKRVLIQYGSSVAPLELFIRAARNIQNLSVKNSLLKKLSSDNMKVLRWFAENLINIQKSRLVHTPVSYGNTDIEFAGQLLLTLLRATGSRKASDERDRVYALLGLLPVNLDIFPNYRVATPWVYTRVVRSIIATTGSLDVLCGDLGRKNRGDLPSWVPDWSAISLNEEVRRTEVATKLYNACGNYRFVCYTSQESFWGIACNEVACRETPTIRAPVMHEVREILDQLGLRSWHFNQNRLAIVGAPVDEIRYCSDQFLDLTDVNRLKSLFIQWANDSNLPHKGGISTITQIDTDSLRALVFDLKFVSGKFRRLEDEDERDLRMWFDAKTSSDNQSYQDILGFDYILKFMSTRRRLFWTLNHKLGWGPDSLKAHDKIYVLPGGRTPYVLRNVAYGMGTSLRRRMEMEMETETEMEMEKKMRIRIRKEMRKRREIEGKATAEKNEKMRMGIEKKIRREMEMEMRMKMEMEMRMEMEMIGDCYLYDAMDGKYPNPPNIGTDQATTIIQEDYIRELADIQRLFRQQLKASISERTPDNILEHLRKVIPNVKEWMWDNLIFLV